jgi:hypothetical protein
METLKKDFYYLSKFHNGHPFFNDSNYRVRIVIHASVGYVIISDIPKFSPVQLSDFILSVTTDIYNRYLKEFVNYDDIFWIHENPFHQNAYSKGKTNFSIVILDWGNGKYKNPRWHQWQDSLELFEIFQLSC